MDTIVVASATYVAPKVSNIPMPNGPNFKVWKDTVKIVLGCMDLDIALRQNKLIATEKNANEAKIEKWKLCNRMSVMIVKYFIPEEF